MMEGLLDGFGMSFEMVKEKAINGERHDGTRIFKQKAEKGLPIKTAAVFFFESQKIEMMNKRIQIFNNDFYIDFSGERRFLQTEKGRKDTFKKVLGTVNFHNEAGVMS